LHRSHDLNIKLHVHGSINFCHTCNCAPLPFYKSIIGNFVVYQDRLETNLLKLFTHPENSEWFSIISAIISKVNIADEQKQT